jgi:NitT/TauT family transport system permease protein
MKSSRAFITSLRNEAAGFGLIVAAWAVAALFYPAYVIPSPWTVLTTTAAFLPEDFWGQLAVTLYRVLAGFGLSLVAGTALGTWAYARKWSGALNATMLALQVLPGTVLGVIFLLMFGLGSATPILLITLLSLPTLAINTVNGLAKKNPALEQYLAALHSRPGFVLRTVYLPALVPVLQSNLSLGMGLAVKVVVLGEFIGAQDGLGYLLNRARITLAMPEVFFYLVVLLTITLVFQALQSAFFSFFLQKYFYPE